MKNTISPEEMPCDDAEGAGPAGASETGLETPTAPQKLRWIGDGDGNYESEGGRLAISRRYAPGGSHPCVGWGVDVEGESGTAHLANSFTEAKAWANEEARRRGWDYKLRWEYREPGHHEAALPDGTVLVAKRDTEYGSVSWQCHRKRGDHEKWVASAKTWKNLKNAVKEMAEEAGR